MAINTNMRVEFTEANNTSKDIFSNIYAVTGKMELSLPVTSETDAVVDISNLTGARVLFVTSTLPVTMTLTGDNDLETIFVGDLLALGFDTAEDADVFTTLTISRPVFVPPDPQTDPETVETAAVINVKVLGI